jgi:hypothetical protein
MSLRLLNRVKKKSAAEFARRLRWVILLCCILTATTAFAASEKAPPDRSPQIPAFAPGELLVKFRAQVRKEAAADFQRWFGISTRKTFAINGYQLVKLPEGADIDEALELYLEDPDVEHAEPNYFVHANETKPNDPYFDRLWGLHNDGDNDGVLSWSPLSIRAWTSIIRIYNPTYGQTPAKLPATASTTTVTAISMTSTAGIFM